MIFEDDTFKFRQSWLDTAMRCPEQGRLSIIHPEMQMATDEAIIGTAAHYGIEAVINGDYPPYAIGAAVADYYRTDPDGELTNFRYTKRETVDEMRDLSIRCAEAWVDDLMPQFPVEGAKTEVAFDVKAFEYRGYPIHLKGTADLAPNVPSLICDWKTSGKDYRQKDKQKWAVQPTVYGWAAVLGGIRDDVEYSWPMTFKYGVMVKLKRKCRGQVVTVQRTAAHAAFLAKRIKAFVDLYLDFGTDRPWPLIDEGNYLCSDRWCDFYSICRGAYIDNELDLFGWNPPTEGKGREAA